MRPAQGKRSPPRQFASDNHSGACPEVMAALARANQNHAANYGSDDWTTRATRLIQDLFETRCDVFFTFTGTAANSLAVAAGCQSFHSVICHAYSHLLTDECNAPGFFSPGTHLFSMQGDDGKLTAAAVECGAGYRGDVHHPKPAMVSLAQSTELGTVYDAEELRSIGREARKNGLIFHMDGARLGNAVASLGVKPRRITWEAGVDVLTLGGTKNGMMMGEAVVFFNWKLADGFQRRCKQAGQLGSKSRFLGAQWVGLLEKGAWLRNARHANRMAHELEKAVRNLKDPRFEIMYPRQANAVFVDMPAQVVKKLWKRGWHFYTDVGPVGARFMCSWDTRLEDVRALVRDIKKP